MLKPTPDRKPDASIFHLLPNLLTIIAICAGLTAIRFGYEGRFETAAHLILIACILDGLDGRLARMMNCSSSIGAELDSLADFINFGVAPVLVLHSWVLQDHPGAGWIAVLFYTICCVLRLARFNVSSRERSDGGKSDFFTGVPSPAGAVIVMMPMVVSFALAELPLIPPWAIAAHICIVGLLMISNIPTYSFKNLSIDRDNAGYFLFGGALLVLALLTYLWATLVVLTFGYLLSLAWSISFGRPVEQYRG